MKDVLFSLVVLSAVVVGCARSDPRGPVVITAPDELDQRVGQEVTLRGVVSNTKIPQLLGVDINSSEPDLRGQRAEATGVLHRYEVTQQTIDRTERQFGKIAHRGAGVFYELKAPNSDQRAQVRTPR